MSFLNKINVPLINSKITAIGRQKIAEGTLNFKYFSFGDSQVHYPNNNSQFFLAPKDKNPNLKYVITKSDCNPYNDLTGIKVLECCLHNTAKIRSFFDEENNYDFKTNGYLAKSDTIYFKTIGEVFSQQFNGTKFIDLQTVKFEDGDFILFKITNPTLGYISVEDNSNSVIQLIFKITKTPGSTIVELDRNLPYLDYSDILIHYYIFDPNIDYYSQTNAEILWDYENLSFKMDCLDEDTLVWNFNTIWSENVIGTQDNQQQYTDYCSYDYLGQKEYLGYNIDCIEETPSTNCDDKLLGINEDYIKAIGIIHYTNKNKNNFYGEYFHIETATDFELFVPNIMWHRRFALSGSTTGVNFGMNFKVNPTKKFLTNTNIEYYDIIEDSTLIDPQLLPITVGRVYSQLKIATIHHPELLASMSIKANRNFSLPALSGKMVNNSNGILPKNKTLYLTYTMESNTAVQHILPQQQYLKFINNTNSAKDIEFSLERSGFLPYMRQKEAVGYDGLGFYFHRIKVLYQIVDNGQKPSSNNWLQIDYTTNYLVDLIGNTLNPLKIEDQNSQLTGFFINQAKVSSATAYNASVLGIPDENCPDKMGFGCETVFLGNLKIEAGACVYKSILELELDSDVFIKSTNPSWGNEPVKLSEIGIYDKDYNLVWYNSLFEQIEIAENSKTLFEIQMDF